MSKQEGITVKKEKDFSEWYSQAIYRSDLCDIRYGVKGFQVNKWWATKMMKLMYHLYEEELERKGHKPYIFPTLIPESNLKKEAEHVQGFSAEVFWVTEGGSRGKKFEERLALRPTSETAIYPMFSKWIRSHRDLPLKTYQSVQVFRYESKMTRPFLRGREFWWIETHNAFASREEAEKQVEDDMHTSEKIMHLEFGIPFIFFKRPEWDKFPGAVYTFAADSIMPTGKALQQPSNHFLGQKFSIPFDVKYVNVDDKEEYTWQTCYGPCIWRMVGSIVGLHGDNKGLVIPPAIAPYQIVIVPIFTTKNEKKIVKEAEKLAEKLKNFRIYVDSRREYTPGWKYNEWELKGVPIRIEIGPRDIEKNQAVLVRRDNSKKEFAKQKNIENTVSKTLDEIQSNLVKKADRYFKSMQFKAENMKDLINIIKKKGGFVKVPICSVSSEGTACGGKIKDQTGGADVRGEKYREKNKPAGKCVACNKKANHYVYVAKSY